MHSRMEWVDREKVKKNFHIAIQCELGSSPPRNVSGAQSPSILWGFTHGPQIAMEKRRE